MYSYCLKLTYRGFVFRSVTALRKDPWIKERPGLLKTGISRFLDATPPSVKGILPPLADEAVKSSVEEAAICNRRKNKTPRKSYPPTDAVLNYETGEEIVSSAAPPQSHPVRRSSRERTFVEFSSPAKKVRRVKVSRDVKNTASHKEGASKEKPDQPMLLHVENRDDGQTAVTPDASPLLEQVVEKLKSKKKRRKSDGDAKSSSKTTQGEKSNQPSQNHQVEAPELTPSVPALSEDDTICIHPDELQEIFAKIPLKVPVEAAGEEAVDNGEEAVNLQNEGEEPHGGATADIREAVATVAESLNENGKNLFLTKV